MSEMIKASQNDRQMGALDELFGARLQKNASMARYTAARVGGQADALLVAQNSAQLVEAVSRLWELGVPFVILGSGSNVLVSDAGIAGVVILNNARQIRFEEQGEAVSVHAESGIGIGLLAHKCAARGFSGLEWAAGIPGTVGGAVVGNAGAHDGDVAGSLILAEILHPVGMKGQTGSSAQREEWPVENLAYAYRTSILKKEPGNVVLSATFKLERSTPDAVLAVMERNNEQRKRTQPPGASMGSMFKNPPGDYAGRLIEACGLKGARSGAAEISSLHANFFINRGQATAADIYTLIQTARSAVAEKFGLVLELEIELIGNWVVNG